ncbi:MAG: hypothetical protein F4W91_10435 [Gemmatimonadetes bacterium]|nr:hypothetical protein [Gemmatimonadota bacterium]
MAKLWRLHLRPKCKDPKDVVRYCLRERILGLGWRGPAQAKGMRGEEYMEEHRKHWGKVVYAVREFMKVKKNHLIWARDEEGGYLLGRVKSMPHPRWDCNAKKYDMCHVVSAHIVGGRSGSEAIRDNEVPGLIKARFSQPRSPAFQSINDDHARDYSCWLFAKKTGADYVPPRPEECFINLLDSYDLEDLVVLYLQQDLNWRVVLSSHAPNTPRYEVTLVRQSLSAGVQVKHKGQDINASLYKDDAQVDQVFLFAASGNYGNNIPKNVTIIHPDELIEFARQNLSLLPKSIKYWWDCSLEAGD